MLLKVSEPAKRGAYLLLRQLGNVVYSSVRLDLGIEMIDNGPEIEKSEHFTKKALKQKTIPQP